jgi:hypothetical protein
MNDDRMPIPSRDRLLFNSMFAFVAFLKAESGICWGFMALGCVSKVEVYA